MITRLKIDGFKNLRGIDLRFSEFTCIAGPNGSGKSNLFDAIQFLSLTAEKTILEAALAVRGDGGVLSGYDHIFLLRRSARRSPHRFLRRDDRCEIRHR